METAVLINTAADWKFHSLHWSMPVDQPVL